MFAAKKVEVDLAPETSGIGGFSPICQLAGCVAILMVICCCFGSACGGGWW